MGYRIFVLCAMQLRNNWRVAVRISWFWWLLLTVANYVPEADQDQKTGDPVAGFLFIVSTFAGLALYLFGATIIAIGWHRFVLREERPAGQFDFWRGWPVRRYVYSFLKVGLIIFVFAAPLMVLIGSSHQFKGMGVAVIPILVLIVLVTWLFLRLGLILPAIALGEFMTIKESFKLTGPISGQLMITACLLVALQTIPVLLLGAGALATGTDLFYLSVPVEFVLSWINLLLGIGVLTVLYGHLYEGRPI